MAAETRSAARRTAHAAARRSSLPHHRERRAVSSCPGSSSDQTSMQRPEPNRNPSRRKIRQRNQDQLLQLSHLPAPQAQPFLPALGRLASTSSPAPASPRPRCPCLAEHAPPASAAHASGGLASTGAPPLALLRRCPRQAVGALVIPGCPLCSREAAASPLPTRVGCAGPSPRGHVAAELAEAGVGVPRAFAGHGRSAARPERPLSNLAYTN